MASTSVALTLTSPYPSAPLRLKPPTTAFFTRTAFKTFPHHHHIRTTPTRSIKTRAFDFSNTFFEEGFDRDDDEDSGEDPASNIGSILMGIGDEEKEEPPCPPGLRKYETMTVLRPDLSEDQRLGLTQKYEELLVAGGGMYVNVFNRGVIPLAYPIKRRNKDGVINTFLDGIYLLFTYFTKPESMPELEETLRTDDSVIRFSSFKSRKKKQVQRI